MRRLRMSLLGVLLAASAAGADSLLPKEGGSEFKNQAVGAVRAAKGDITCGQIGAIACGQTVTGSLVLADDCALTDGTVIDQYSFMATAGQMITADLQSADFDSFLFLTDTDFNVLASDDDGGGGLNSRIEFTFPNAGEVFLLANSLTPEEGDYSLSVSCSGGNEPGDTYALHEHWSQIFWNPGLNGWGFAFDIQKGLLFGAVYGYANDGSPTFYTLISDKVPAASSMNFQGDVFRTTGNGNVTADVGDFTFDLAPVDGQPGGRLTMTSPSANFDDLQLIRFGFLDSDELSILTGQLATLTVVEVDQINDQAGGIVLFDNDRMVVSGETGVLLSTGNPNASGFFFYDDAILEYVALLTSTENSDVGILEGVVGDHKDMTGLGVLVNESGTPLSGESLFRISALGANEASTKALRNKVALSQPSEKQIEDAISAYQSWRWSKRRNSGGLLANLAPEEGDYSPAVSPRGAAGGTYALHEHWSQIFWNPGLNGWGFAVDIQKGLLFGAVYGYANDGSPTFYTLISDKVPAASSLDFQGDVFQTTANGSSTADVGDFTFDLVSVDGQPGGRLTMTSPSANFDDLQLVRFGFLDSDELSILTGQLATLTVVEVDQINDQAGGLVLFENDRMVVSGETGVLLSTANPNASGFFFYDDAILEYVVLLTSTENPDVGILEGVVGDHKDMTGLGVLVNESGTPLSGESLFRISALGANEASTKALRNKVAASQPSEKQIENAISAYQSWRRSKQLD